MGILSREDAGGWRAGPPKPLHKKVYSGTTMAARSTNSLPLQVKKLFWDLEPRFLRLDRDQGTIIGRVLASGPWETVQWLRAVLGDDAIRGWIEEHEGRGLSPPQLRYWQLMLGIPKRVVDAWLRSEGRQVWDRRAP